MNKEREIKRTLTALITISLVIRVLAAFFTELGNDEAYYWTYALYPDLSHFEHPPMLGWLIQLFTINLSFSSEIFIRLPSIILGTLNIWLIFIIGRRLKNSLTGLYAALLYIASPYCTIVSGILIFPDTPLTFFYLLSAYFLLEGMFPKYGINSESIALSRFASIISAVFIGFAMLSKFSAFFLWVSVILYALFFHRDVLKRPILYYSAAISLLLLTPVILWNITNSFVNIGIYTHSIKFTQGADINSFLKEASGVLFYNNPVNILIIIAAIVGYRRYRYLEKGKFQFLLFLSFPIILTFIFISLFRTNLPQLSAPGFFGLILIAAAYLAEKYKDSPILIPSSVKIGLSLIIITIFLGFTDIRTGFLNFDYLKKENPVLSKDPTLSMYGWKQLSHKFNEIRNRDIADGTMNKHSGILSRKWYDAAHLDYYLATPDSIQVKTLAPVGVSHKYAWITKFNGGFRHGESFYYFASAKEGPEISRELGKYFEKSDTASVIYIFRAGRPVKRYTLIRFKNMTTMPPGELASPVKIGM